MDTWNRERQLYDVPKHTALQLRQLQGLHSRENEMSLQVMEAKCPFPVRILSQHFNQKHMKITVSTAEKTHLRWNGTPWIFRGLFNNILTATISKDEGGADVF
jgi:hypothetical protein